MQDIFGLYIGRAVKFTNVAQKGEAFLHGVVNNTKPQELSQEAPLKLLVRVYYPNFELTEAYQDFTIEPTEIKLQLKDLAKLTELEKHYLKEEYDMIITEPRHQIFNSDLNYQGYSVEKMAVLTMYLAKQGYSLGLLPQKFYDILP